MASIKTYKKLIVFKNSKLFDTANFFFLFQIEKKNRKDGQVGISVCCYVVVENVIVMDVLDLNQWLIIAKE